MGRTKKKAVSKKRMSKKQKVKKGGSNINEQKQNAKKAAQNLISALDKTAKIAKSDKHNSKCGRKNGPAAPATYED